MNCKEWESFNDGIWKNEINVRNFIQKNYEPYTGDASFLESPTENTKKLWNEILDLYKKEKENNGVLDIDAEKVSTISSHEARLYR